MRKIRRRCKCGCGGITNPGRKYIFGHHKPMLGRKHTKEAKLKISLASQDRIVSTETKEKMSEAKKGKKQTIEHILNNSLAKMKHNPDYQYCEVWKDKEYTNDIRKDHCENRDCKKICERLCNHHIHLDKKKCKPNDLMTMCISCHVILHRKLEQGINKAANPKDFIIINRPNHVSYIHKKSREIIKLRRLICQSIQ